jgi:exopolysaccharide biosynthesis polyprenyl glycosylphosphotransferase
MKDRFWIAFLVCIDLITASSSWGLFFYMRQVQIEHKAFHADQNFWLGILCLPFFWFLFYVFQGTYHEIRRLFRLKVLNLTLAASFFGTLVLFFALLLDDQVQSYQNYYQLTIWLFIIHLALTSLGRILFTTILIKYIKAAGHGFKTLIIGGNERAIEIYQELLSARNMINNFVGFIQVNGRDNLLSPQLSHLGKLPELEEVLASYQVEEVIIAIESTDHDRLQSIIARIDNGKIRIRILPDMYSILAGSVDMTNIYGALLIEINPDVMPYWQRAVKRLMDIVISLIALLCLIPFFIFSAIAVKLSSPGTIFFLQDRVGRDGKRFKIIKFRTMYTDAEKAGPQLSKEGDPRITPIGRFMRKTRLDEFPQFVNVLLGQMSLVGPRPERQFYIDQIVAVEPQYMHLTRVRPGITSWGQVKYGYAENVEQMLQRMKFDLIYMKNRSLALDIKIMFYTVIIVFKAQGK